MLIDFHSHILHNIDDGPSDINVSLKMLAMSKKQGVDVIIATPHVARQATSPKSLAEKRDTRINEIIDAANAQNISIPIIKKGFEVYNKPEMITDENLKHCQIENTKNILLEMPFSSWTNAHFNVINQIKELGYTPVLAHIERYLSIAPKPLFDRLIDMNLFAQVSAPSFINKEIAPFVLEMIALGKIHVVGSDAHNMMNRCSLMDVAMRIIKNKLGEKYISIVNEHAVNLLGLQ